MEKDPFLPLQHIEIRKIGDMGKADHRYIQHTLMFRGAHDAMPRLQPLRQTVLVIQIHLLHGDHTGNRDSQTFLDHPKSWS